MTRPDPNSPDSGAHQDDAVWLDLVARLEGIDQPVDPQTGPRQGASPGTAPGAGPDQLDTGSGAGSGSGSGGSVDDGAGRTPRAFREFDPLGLSAPAPVEPSARERSATAAGSIDSNGHDAHDSHDAPAGPRDYVADEEDGDFVPEDPPSLAGADPMLVLAWLGAVGGPVALVLSAMFWRAAPVVAVLGMVAVFAASVVFLIMKLPGDKDEHDDGARV